MSKEVGKYEANVICDNCGQINVISLELGESMEWHLRRSSEKCSNCECRINSNEYKTEPKGL